MTRLSPETPNRREPEVSSPLIYLAGPLFSKAERQFNLQLTAKLEALGFRVFLRSAAAWNGRHLPTKA